MIVIFSLFTVSVIAFFSYLIQRRTENPIRVYFWAGLILKLLAGISLGLVYTYFYSANDTFLFFSIAKKITVFARESPLHYFFFLWQDNEDYTFLNDMINLEPRSLFFAKFLSVINLFTGDNYWLSSLWFSFFSFLGCWYLFVQLDKIKQAKVPAAIALLFFPSFLFWGSGIIKESIAVGSLCFITGFFLAIMQGRKRKPAEWIILPVTCLVLWNLKYYWAAVLFPALITSLILKFVVERWFILKGINELVMWVMVFLILCLGISFVHPNFYLDRLLGVVIDNYNLFALISEPEGMIHYYRLSDSWISIIMNAPWALWSGLFRPFIFEGDNLFQIAASLENLVLLILFISSFFSAKNIVASPWRLLVFSAIGYVTFLCIFLALSTPNLGTLSRYRIGFLHIFLFLILYRNPLIRKISFLKKSF
jgi:hypothetical protein